MAPAAIAYYWLCHIGAGLIIHFYASAIVGKPIDDGLELGFPFPVNCGIQPESDKIVGGVLASLDEFPWMALLKYRAERQYGYGCGGSLLNQWYVLTAAHCLVGKFGPPVAVILGEYDVDTAIDCTGEVGFKLCADPPQDIDVEKRISHPDYKKESPTKMNDIALLKLKSPAKYTDFIRPVCVPTSDIFNELVKPSATLLVSGWGRTKHQPSSNIKRKARVPFVSHEECAKNRTVPIGPSQICFGGGKLDACSGDSGGPLMGIYSSGPILRWYQCGIVSYGRRECGIPTSSSVYTNVLFYRDWLGTNMVL